MRKHFHAALLAVIGVGLLSSACDIKSPVDGAVELRVNFTAARTLATLSMINAANGSAILDNATVQFTGAGSERVVDALGNALGAAPTFFSYVTFGVSGTPPTPQHPLTLHMTVTAPGFADVSRDIVLTDSLNGPINVPMLKLAGPPVGIAVAQVASGTANTNGALTQALVASTPPDGQSAGVLGMQVPAGTTLRDAAGAPLSGALTTTAIYYNGSVGASQALSPAGGTTVPAQVNDGTATQASWIIPAAWADIKVQDANGHTAHTFTGGQMNITMDIPNTAYNAAAGRLVAAGDVIPYWSYDADTRIVKKEGVVTLPAAMANGNYRVTLPMSHLSAVITGSEPDVGTGQVCGIGATYKIIVHGNKARYQVTYAIDMVKDNSAPFYLYGGNSQSTDTIFTVGAPVYRNFSYDRTIVVTAYPPYGGTASAQTHACGGTAELTLPPTPAPAKVAFNVTVTCGGGTQVRPTSFVFALPVNGANARSGGFLFNGVGTISGLSPNAAYIFWGSATVNGKTKWGNAILTTGDADSITPANLSYDFGSGC